MGLNEDAMLVCNMDVYCSEVEVQLTCLSV